MSCLDSYFMRGGDRRDLAGGDGGGVKVPPAAFSEQERHSGKRRCGGVLSSGQLGAL
jgi:hypothetical protein